ncbi:hypothetical protein ASG40_01030 [Methylobacterium sp. Leaf399]|uniref:hypothetical protein n=1 Tax=Methylobacterium sp. Leaf108 TaxID=1736256 RepID=UPI0006F6E02B|nr:MULTISPECIES: hypothetical protein [unclassified Methylobacterium]KQP61313.1 hypothetical protein ASF39_01035 [Methylobacterium sp. Leaf108]KQT19461.1 hypothetical protein ASG40_01030 [Methylobacterium sp. Leaf399]
MRVSSTVRIVLAAAVVGALASPAFARGGSGSGSGLSPYAAESGNDRSAGVNNGNYRSPRLDPYLGAYEGRGDRPVRYDRRGPRPSPPYGYPY